MPSRESQEHQWVISEPGSVYGIKVIPDDPQEALHAKMLGLLLSKTPYIHVYPRRSLL